MHRLKTKFEQESTVKRKKKGSGRPRKTSQEQDQAIVQTHEDDPFLNQARAASEFDACENVV